MLEYDFPTAPALTGGIPFVELNWCRSLKILSVELNNYAPYLASLADLPHVFRSTMRAMIDLLYIYSLLVRGSQLIIEAVRMTFHRRVHHCHPDLADIFFRISVFCCIHMNTQWDIWNVSFHCGFFLLLQHRKALGNGPCTQPQLQLRSSRAHTSQLALL